MQHERNKMENIKELVIEIGAMITAFGIIVGVLKKWQEVKFDEINHNFQDIRCEIKSLDKHQCRNYLVDFLTDIENGAVKNDAQITRAYELYDHYRNDLKGNSYIQDKWNKLMK